MEQGYVRAYFGVFAACVVFRVGVVIALLVCADQFTKSWVVGHISQGQVIPIFSWLNFVHVQNTGIAFSLFSEASSIFMLVLSTVSIVIALGLLGSLRCLHYWQWQGCSVIALLLGGALGNIIDRQINGYVVDFIDCHWHYWHFAQFNVADMAITIGGVLFLLMPRIELAVPE